MLPVCNQALIDSPLRLLESSNISDVLVLCRSGREVDDISSWARRRSNAASGPRVDVWNVEADEEAEEKFQGTAGALRWAASKGLLKSDFVLLPCDLYLAPGQGEEVLAATLDAHRREDRLLTAVLSQIPEDTKVKGVSFEPAD